MVSLGMFASYALSIARRSRGFIAGSAPPRRAATVTSLISRVKVLPFFSSAAAFLWRMFAHLECPDMRAARFRGQGTHIILSFDPRAKPKRSERTTAGRNIEERGAAGRRVARDASSCKII